MRVTFAQEMVNESKIQCHYTGAGRIVEAFFPELMQQAFWQCPINVSEIAEIRARVNQPIRIASGHNQEAVLHIGDRPMILDSASLEYMVQRINQSSVYAWEEEYRRGYLTLPGGHRVGLAGKILLEDGRIRTMKQISSLNFRIAHEVIGAADGLMPYLYKPQGIRNTLLVAPPGCGKTTLLRDIARQLSDGVASLGAAGVNVGVVDERSELAGTVSGIAQLKIGERSDVLDGCPKSVGMHMLIRAMAPQVIITDEMGSIEDVQAMEDALNAGVAVVTSIHGRAWSDLEGRHYLLPLLQANFFDCIVFLSNRHGVGTMEKLLIWRDGAYMAIK